MSWAAIMAIVVEILKQRAAAGWPLLKMLLDYFGWKVLEEADADKEKLKVGAAPDALKDQIIEWLEEKKATAGVGMKFVYTLMIRFVPLVADQIWDSLFDAGSVAKPASDFPPRVMGAEQTEEEIVKDCCDE